MPRNTVASKALAGPSNTLDSETVTVLNPQAELVAANAEIKWLWELLEARDTLVSGDESLLDTQRLVTVFATLSQRLSKTYVVLSWSAKVTESPLLIDGIDFIFDNWKL